jgi:hypothetical protein
VGADGGAAADLAEEAVALQGLALVAEEGREAPAGDKAADDALIDNNDLLSAGAHHAIGHSLQRVVAPHRLGQGWGAGKDE